MQRHRHFEDKSIFAHSLKNRLLLSACWSFILLSAGTLWARSEPVSFSPPSQKYIIDTASVPLSPAMFFLLNATASQKPQALRQVLDSLGYFSASIDSSVNTITVRPGYQCRVDSVIIHSMVPCAVDSIQRNMFPRPYDAGELQMLAQRIVYFFGRKGYPFAELTVGVSPVHNDSGAHASHIPSVTITYDVRVNGFYVWGEPFIVGQIQTSPNLIKQDILIKKGDIFDVAAIAASKKRLQTRQYIASIETGQAGIERDVKPCADTVTGFPDTSCAGSVRVPFLITDKTGLGFDGALAFQAGSANSTALTGIVNLSLLNLFHHGESGTLTYRGEKNYQKVDMSASVPYVLGLSLFVTGGFGLEILQDSYSYFHGTAEVLTEMAPGLSWGFAFNTHEITQYTDTVTDAQQSSHYTGADFVVYQGGLHYKAGLKSSAVTFKLGSGLSYKNGRQLNRWHVDVNAAQHLPLSPHQALFGRFFVGTMLADQQDTLLTVERYRVGGYKSLRGYTDDQFSCAKLYYQQLEYMYYFSENGSVFVFVDAGIGFDQYASISMPDATKMLGYGVGLRIPVKLGLGTFAWARNYKDSHGWGRIHVAIQNDLSLQ